MSPPYGRVCITLSMVAVSTLLAQCSCRSIEVMEGAHCHCPLTGLSFPSSFLSISRSFLGTAAPYSSPLLVASHCVSLTHAPCGPSCCNGPQSLLPLGANFSSSVLHVILILYPLLPPFLPQAQGDGSGSLSSDRLMPASPALPCHISIIPFHLVTSTRDRHQVS